jgi:hypothetical protein
VEFQPLLIPGAHISAVKKNHVIVVSNRFFFAYREAKPQGFAERYPTLVTGFFFFVWYVLLPESPISLLEIS